MGGALATRKKQASRRKARKPVVRGTRNRRIDILEAAMRLFAEKGFDGTGMREIAKSAGVSLGLVTQFYGTKDELHRAVDDRVLTEFSERVGALPDEHNFMETGYREVVRFIAQHELQYRYIRRALVEDSPGSNEFFRRYHQMQIDVLKRAKRLGGIAGDVDETWGALVLIFLALGPIFCMNQVEAILGKSVFDVKLIEHRNKIYARLIQRGFGASD
jgi:AcrR family transcriptional regulator